MSIKHLLDGNTAWVRATRTGDSTLFPSPTRDTTTLWLGCADGPTAPEIVTNSPPGSMLVHRNMGNLARTDDDGWLSTLQYAVDELHVSDIVVCGHQGCDACWAAMEGSLGTMGRWLEEVRAAAAGREAELASLPDDSARVQRMVELNVRAQVLNVARAGVVKRAWEERRGPRVHGWVYAERTGRLIDLELTVTSVAAADALWREGEVIDWMRAAA